MASLTVPARCNGPASSGNGGWTAGALAEVSGLDPVTVRLLRPPPLETPLDVVEGGEGGVVELRSGADVVARAQPHGPPAWTAWQPVGVEEARSCEAAYPGLRSHPFPRCFSCGPDRDDGLRIFPGRLDGDRVAATWVPDASVSVAGAVPTPVTWAALDCVGGWSSDLQERPLVLAEMCARVRSRPQAGRTYAVAGTTTRVEGRKTWTATAVFDRDGLLLGQAEQLWIEVDAATVARLQG